MRRGAVATGVVFLTASVDSYFARVPTRVLLSTGGGCCFSHLSEIATLVTNYTELNSITALTPTVQDYTAIFSTGLSTMPAGFRKSAAVIDQGSRWPRSDDVHRIC